MFKQQMHRMFIIISRRERERERANMPDNLPFKQHKRRMSNITIVTVDKQKINSKKKMEKGRAVK